MSCRTSVYTESTDVPASRARVAFRPLVEAPRRPHVNAVVIPSPDHFSRFGGMYRPCAPSSPWRPARTC